MGLDFELRSSALLFRQAVKHAGHIRLSSTLLGMCLRTKTRCEAFGYI